MKKYFSLNYFRQLIRWVWLGKFHILTFAVVIVTILYVTERLNFYPTIVSTILSITGLFIILNQQILDSRQFADHKPNTISNWMRSFPTGKPIIGTVNSTLHALGTLDARIIVSLRPDATIEEKIDFLLRQVTSIQDNIANVGNRIHNVELSLTKRSQEFEAELGKIDESLKTIIAGHIVGTYDINLFGIMITICGIIIQFFCA